MAASGTGLPTSRGDVATTLTDMGAFGTGEALAADALQQVAASFDKIEGGLQAVANKRAEAQAEQDVLAGVFQERMSVTMDAAAYNQAMRTGTLARLSNSADADLDALRAEHIMDPDGYQSAAAEYRTNALAGAVPGSIAMDWAVDFDRRANAHLGVIRNARAQTDLTEAKNGTIARISRLTDETISLRPGASLSDVMADETVAGNMFQITQLYESLANNAAFGISREEVDGLARETRARIKAGAFAAFTTEVLRTQGPDAAYATLQDILNPAAGSEDGAEDEENPLSMTREERQLAFNTARAAITDELGVANQRRAQADSERSQRLQEVGRLIDEDIAGIELTGSGTGLTEAQVRELGGTPAVSAWLKRKAEAQEFHGVVGALPLDDPDAAAAQIARAVSQRGLESLPVIQNDSDLDSVLEAMSIVETPGASNLISRDPDGAGGGAGGAVGDMQVLPATARRVAARLGIPYDENRLLNDVAYNRQIARGYLSELIDQFGGDTFLGVTAYHAGPALIEAWLKPSGTITRVNLNGRMVDARGRGDPRTGQITREAWLASIEQGNPLSAGYPRKVLAAMNGGRANAQWDAYQGRRTVQQTDPARSVATDFAVQTAAQRWRANPNSVPAAEGMVSATMDAQERAGIAAGARRTLPLEQLMIYAGRVETFARANDTENFAVFQRQVIRTFGRHGEKVMQDVLEVRGDSRYAAMLSARVATQAARGQRPAPADVEQAGRAATTNTMARSAAGTSQPASAMTDEQVMAAAGLSQ